MHTKKIIQVYLKEQERVSGSLNYDGWNEKKSNRSDENQRNLLGNRIEKQQL